MDLNKMVKESLVEMDTKGIVLASVNKHVQYTVDKIVEDVFGRYSDFGKDLKKEVEEQLSLDLKKLNIRAYNHMVLEVIKQKIDESVTTVGIETIKEELDALLGSGEPPSYKLSELVDFMKAEQADDEDYFGQKISLHVQDRTSLTFIRMDPDIDKESYECKYDITVRNDTGQIHSIEINGTEFDNRLIMGGLHGLAKVLFKLYTMKGTVKIDEDYIDEYHDNPYET